MKRKHFLSIFLTLAMVLTSLHIMVPVKSVTAATTWNNTADVSWIDSSKKIVAFAFDDGPVSNGTTATRILDTLEKYNSHATFFYIGNQITNYNQSEIQRAFRLGNEIANHTWTHPYLTNMSSYQIQDEVNKTTNLLRSITGQSSAKYLVRPPYLATNQTVFNAIDTPLITCSLDSQDWNGASKDTIISRVLNGVQDGSILLMHETYNSTADAVAYLVPELIKRGYAVTSVSELFKMKGKAMTSGQVYTSCSGRNVVINNQPSAAPSTQPSVAPTPSAGTSTGKLPAGVSCTYKVTSDWGNGYQGEIVIKNGSSTAINNWTLNFTLSNKIQSLWGADFVGQSGSTVTVKCPSWSSTLAAGSSVSICFVADGSSSNSPSGYALQ